MEMNYLENQFGTLGTETSENIINKESIELLEKIDVAQKDVKTCSFYFLSVGMHFFSKFC